MKNPSTKFMFHTFHGVFWCEAVSLHVPFGVFWVFSTFQRNFRGKHHMKEFLLSFAFTSFSKQNTHSRSFPQSSLIGKNLQIYEFLGVEYTVVKTRKTHGATEANQGATFSTEKQSLGQTADIYHSCKK